jgi:hypothetical protein
MRITNTIRFLLPLLIIFLVSACATKEEVKGIVDNSNKTIILASLGSAGSTLSATQPVAVGTDWQTEVERIEEFIANNPDQVHTNNALRIREAVILLGAQKPNLTRAVFAEVKCDELGNKRDQAICLAQDHLIWWYNIDHSALLSTQDKVEARKALDKDGLAKVAEGLELSSSTRRALEEMRVRIAMLLARSLTDKKEIREILNEALERYAKQFDQNDQKAIQQWHMTNDLSPQQRSTLMRSLRWYDYVPDAFKKADRLFQLSCEANVPGCPFQKPGWIACIEDKSCQ